MITIVLTVHIIVCLALILLVLLQVGKGANLAGLFGGGSGSETLFGGPSGDIFLKKVTVFLAVIFMVTSLYLAIYSRQAPSSIIKEEAVQETMVKEPAEKKSEPLQVEEKTQPEETNPTPVSEDIPIPASPQ